MKKWAETLGDWGDWVAWLEFLEDLKHQGNYAKFSAVLRRKLARPGAIGASSKLHAHMWDGNASAGRPRCFLKKHI